MKSSGARWYGIIGMLLFVLGVWLFFAVAFPKVVKVDSKTKEFVTTVTEIPKHDYTPDDIEWEFIRTLGNRSDIDIYGTDYHSYYPTGYSRYEKFNKPNCVVLRWTVEDDVEVDQWVLVMLDEVAQFRTYTIAKETPLGCVAIVTSDEWKEWYGTTGKQLVYFQVLGLKYESSLSDNISKVYYTNSYWMSIRVR